MIRTVLSFFVLFGALAVASRWLFDSTHNLPTSASESPAAIEPRSEDAKLLPSVSTHALNAWEDNNVQLVAFDDPLDEVLDSLKPTSGVKGRVDDEEEEAASEDATT